MLTRPPVEGNTCNLDCLKKNPIRTFDGPVKIVLVDIPRKEYCQRIWMSGFIGLSYLMIGFTSVTMMLYACSWHNKNWAVNLHILFCTIGFQLLMPIGILMTTNLNGPSAPLKPIDRKYTHVGLQVVANIINPIAAIIMLKKGGEEWPQVVVNTGHCFAGLCAITLSALGAFCGSFMYSKSSCAHSFKPLHACLGLSAFFASSICYIYSFEDAEFLSWLPLNSGGGVVMAIFVGIYTVVVITYPAYKLLCFDDCPNRAHPQFVGIPAK